LFEVHSSKKIYHANNIQHISDVQISNSLPYVVRTTTNNGLRGFIIEDETYANEGNTLSFAQDTFSVFYQKQKYFTGNKVKVLKGKFENQSEQVMSYLTVCFQKALSEFTWGVGSTVESIVETKIMLPVYDNKINFDFMEAFIATLKAERLATLKAYLTVTGLSNTTLSAEEDSVLSSLESQTWKTFEVKQLFSIKNTHSILSRDIVPNSGKIPYLTAGQSNNSVGTHIQFDNAYIDEGNCIFIGGKTFVVTYQKDQFFSNDSHNLALYHKELDKRTKNNLLFMATSIYKSLSPLYSWGDSISNKKIQKDIMQLPITDDGLPDYDTMNLVVSALQKVVIQGVVSYLDERIEKTGELV
jgi:hypothetical protein